MKEGMIMWITFWAIGGLLVITAYFIGIKKKINLIAGVNKQNADQIKDIDGLAKFMGIVSLVLGIIHIAFPFVGIALGIESMALWIGYMVVILSMIVLAVIFPRKYIK